MSEKCIYGLYFEKDGKKRYFYVGSSKNMPPRLREHQYSKRTRHEDQYEYIRHLDAQGIAWHWEVIHTPSGTDYARDWERWHVIRLTREGHTLTNMRHGSVEHRRELAELVAAPHIRNAADIRKDREQPAKFTASRRLRRLCTLRTGKIAPVQPNKPKPEPAKETDTVSVEWILARLEEMKAEHQAGKSREDRETILARLGFGDYESYRYSPLWQKIRRRILKRDGSSCTRCGDRATQVHHLAYTDAVMKGEDDAQLVSVCATCHDKVEFDEARGRRPEHEKRRVLEDRDGARQEKIAAEQARLQLEERTARVRDAAGGRCFRCKGDTNSPWSRDASVCSLPSINGGLVEEWMCSACRHALAYDKNGKANTDEQKLKLLHKKPTTRYTRPEPSVGFTSTKAFRKLNAMQREGIMNEFEWNAERIQHPDLEETDPSRFAELRRRYESTQSNGRERGTRRKTRA